MIGIFRNRPAPIRGNARTTASEHRPDYLAAAVRWALEPIATPTPVALDPDAGTGKPTEGLLALGAEVIAVERDAGRRHPRRPPRGRYPEHRSRIDPHGGPAEATTYSIRHGVRSTALNCADIESPHRQR